MVEQLKFVEGGISIEGEKHLLEDLVNVVRDGAEPSTTISDLIFSIEVALELNGMSRDGGEPEASRIDKINAYKSNEALLADAKAQRIQAKTQELANQIQHLKPRIDELLATGNACLANGIEIDAYHNRFDSFLDSYERGTFLTNSISHKVGFAPPAQGTKTLTMLGINAGGACGAYDFRTDGEKVYSVHESRRDDIQPPSVAHMEKFLTEFDAFESDFYAYVDKTLEKQQKSVDAVLTEAYDRSVATGSAPSDRDVLAKE